MPCVLDSNLDYMSPVTFVINERELFTCVQGDFVNFMVLHYNAMQVGYHSQNIALFQIQ